MGERSTDRMKHRESTPRLRAGKRGRGRPVLVTCALLLAALAALAALGAPRAAAEARQKTTIGTEIKSVSPSGDAPKAGRTRIVVLQYAPGTGSMGRPMTFVASNAKTVFIKVTNLFQTRVRVSRNGFVRFWRQKGRSCEVKWYWRTIGGKRVRYIRQISLADQGTA